MSMCYVETVLELKSIGISTWYGFVLIASEKRLSKMHIFLGYIIYIDLG